MFKGKSREVWTFLQTLLERERKRSCQSFFVLALMFGAAQLNVERSMIHREHEIGYSTSFW